MLRSIAFTLILFSFCSATEGAELNRLGLKLGKALEQSMGRPLERQKEWLEEVYLLVLRARTFQNPSPPQSERMISDFIQVTWKRMELDYLLHQFDPFPTPKDISRQDMARIHDFLEVEKDLNDGAEANTLGKNLLLALTRFSVAHPELEVMAAFKNRLTQWQPIEQSSMPPLSSEHFSWARNASALFHRFAKDFPTKSCVQVLHKF